ncbi:Isopentenyl-diphosphate delta-isomerase [Fagus crenata]
MAGIAIVSDLWKKNQSFCTGQSFHSYGLLSASAAYPFAARALFGNFRIPVAHCDADAASPEDYISNIRSASSNFRIPVAHCDAGAALPEDYISNMRSATSNIFQHDSLRYRTKEYTLELKPLFSAFEWRALAMTSLRSFLMFYLPLLEPRTDIEEDDDDFLQDNQEERHVDLVVPFKKSVKQIFRETTVVTTRRVLERIAVHYVSQRMAWKLLKDVPKSAVRKAGRRMPTLVYFYSVSKTTFRGHFLGVAASWLVQVGIEIYRFFSSIFKDGSDDLDKEERVKILGKKVSCATVRCGSSLVFASIGAGIGATLIRPSIGQWIGCAVGDLAGPIIVSVCLEKVLHVNL